MKLNKIFVFIFKKNILTTVFTMFLIFLVIFSKSNMFAAKNGLTLWAGHVIPSLFPFFIATELLNYTRLPYYLGKLTNKLMNPLFNVPGEGSYAFIMGIISGYPVGAKIINKFVEEGTCTKSEAERMLAFTNNSGPLFIIGTVGISLFGDIKIGIILFITHILACLTVGILFGVTSRKKYEKNYINNINNRNINRNINKNRINDKNIKNRNFSNRIINKTNNSRSRGNSTTNDYTVSDLGTILSNSINNAISTILLIGGFIVLFSIIISIFNNLKIIDYASDFLSYINIPKEYGKCIITGLLELTNGVNLISSLHTKQMSIQIVVCAFLLGFAGISIFLQIFSIAAKNNLSMKPYLLGKILQGLLAALYTFAILYCFDGFYFNLITI